MCSLVGHTNFSHEEVGGVMSGRKNTYDDYSQVFVRQWNVRNVSPGYDSHMYKNSSPALAVHIL